MEIEALIEEINAKRQHRSLTQNNILINILRRIKKGWWVVILIILTCLFLA